MGRSARGGILVLMGLAIGLARLVEVELDPGSPPPAAVVMTQPARIEESPAPPVRPTPSPAAALQVAPQAVDPAGAPTGEKTHLVVAGETLGTIARKVYGSSRHWKTILDANKDVLASPETMRPGLRLRIPDQPSQGRRQ